MVVFYAVSSLMAILTAWYFYCYFRRVLNFFSVPDGKMKKAVLFLCALIFGLCAADTMGIGFLAVMHVMIIGFFMQFTDFTLKKSFKGKLCQKSGAWQKFYGCGAVPFVLSAVILICGYFNINNVVKTSYRIYTDKEIQNGGYRVALIADVHYGISLDKAKLRQKCTQISNENPDIVILCGDIVDNNTSKSEMKTVFEELGKIESKHGIYFVYGNHDRPMSVVKSDYSVNELNDAIENNGIVILKDEVFEIEAGFTLVGREDASQKYFGGKREEVDVLLKKADKNDFILVADHQPNEYKKNAENGADLVVSGHTHGGQIWPANLIQKIFDINDAVYGITDIGEVYQKAIVTSGFAGWQYPIKTCAAAEYVIIDIERAET